MRFSKIHHIAIIGSDYNASKAFYVDKLGFAVIRENYREERKDWKIDLDGETELNWNYLLNPIHRKESHAQKHAVSDI